MKSTDPNAICAIINTIRTRIPTEAHEEVENLINIDELQSAIAQRKRWKAPGIDGIYHEFFQTAWEITKHDLLSIMKEMYIDEEILESQKTGVLICIAQKPIPTTPSDYRPLTLLYADLKLLSQIIANRMKRWTNTILYTNQYCSAHENIHSAIAAIREMTAHSEQTHRPAYYR
jgi:hypothetical protein